MAGTNGKGSVIAYLYETLRLAGKRTGRYTSPTLFSYRERMEVDGACITEEQFASVMTRTARAAEEVEKAGFPHPTVFELETAAAFLFFLEMNCDLVLIEVGMGGISDATNVLSRPLLSVIASISMDHMEFLGNTLYEIAQKKAGIIKEGCPMVSVRQKPEAEKALREACERNHTEYAEADAHDAVILEDSLFLKRFLYHGEEYSIRQGGSCQIENAVLALRALELLSLKQGISVSTANKKEGLYRMTWRGRFTVLSQKPFFVADGGHNPGAADELAASLEKCFPGRRILFILGMFRDKDHEYVLKKMCPYAAKILVIETPDNPRAFPAEELAGEARKYHPDVEAMPDIASAVRKAYELAGEEDVILAFGSLSFMDELFRAQAELRPALTEYRKRIDAIDAGIQSLFEERMTISEALAEYKISCGKPVMDRKREMEKLSALRKNAHGDFNARGITDVFSQIMAISRKRQYQLMNEKNRVDEEEYRFVDKLPLSQVTAVFQGVEGAYSSAALREFFGDGINSYHVRTWRDAMEEVSQGRADYAVLPIENSTAGIVGDMADLLMEYSLFISGEQVIQVEHVLLGLPGMTLGQVKTVYSHPQGLLQCHEYLESHPDWKTASVDNTAEAARKVKEEGDFSQAAIASREAGRVFGLSVLAEKICSNQSNCTRFIIVGREPVFERNAEKVSICFELPNESGSLYSMLSHIIYNGLNMTRIESRPIPGKTWQYRFFVDFEGNLMDTAVKSALRGLKEEALSLRILGNT